MHIIFNLEKTKKNQTKFISLYQQESLKSELFMFGGITESSLFSTADFGHFTERFYGTPSKRIVLINSKTNKWEILFSGVFPSFIVEPYLLNKKDFRSAMLALGVSADLLERFFNTKGGFTSKN